MSIEFEYKFLEEVCDILDNKRKPITKKDRVEGDYPYYGATGILSYINDYIFDEQLILLGEDGAKWKSGDNSAFIIKGKTWVNNHAHVLKPNSDVILDSWLVYNLNYQNLMPYVSGMTVPKLNQGNMKKIKIPIPKIDQQKQIVKILDKAFEVIDKAKENIEKNIQNSKELFQSRLNEIFSQKGEGWEERSLKELTSKIGSGSTPRGGQSSYKESGISLIRSMNVHDDGFKKDKLAFIDEDQANKLKNVILEENDILLNITGASVARCCIVENEFLHLSLISKDNKDKLLGIGEQGSTRQAITKKQIEDFIIQYPKEKDFQKKVLEELKGLRLQTKQLEKKYQQKLENLEELKKSILQKAFSGELI